MANPQDINKDIDKIIERLSESRDIVQFFNEIRKLTSLSAEDAKALASALKGISKSTKDLIGNFEDVSNGIRKTKDVQKDLTKSIRDQRNLEIEINKQLKSAGFSEDKIKKILENQKISKKDLKKLSEELGIADGLILEEALNNLKVAKENVETNKENVKIAKNYNKALGLSGGLVNGMADAAKKLGVDYNIIYDAIEDAKKSMAEKAKILTENGKKASTFGDKLKIMGVGLSSLFGSMAKGLLDPLIIIGQIVTTLFDLDTQIGKIAKNFGITYYEAARISSELNDIANESNDLFVTTKNLTETFLTLNNRYGTFAKFNSENLKTFTKLTEQAGFTAEEIGSLFDTTFLTGKELEDVSAEYLGQIRLLKAQTGLAINERQVLKDIQNVSSATKIQLGGSAEAIADAVFKARALGMELKDLESVSESLLNFQSSIENELAAELLTGKQLNLEGARYAALVGNQSMLAEELAKNIGTAADFNARNVLQQEALAKAVGLTRDSLADTLLQREVLSKLDQFEGATAKEKYENAVKQLGVEGARKKLGNDALADQMRSASIQERFIAAVEKLKEIFVSLAEPLMPVLDAFAGILKVIAPIAGVVGQIVKFIGPIVNGVASVVKYVIDWGKYLLPIIAAYKTFQVTSGIVLGIQAAFNKEKAFEYITSQKTLAAKIGERTYAIADLVIQKAKNSTLIKNIFLQNQSNIVSKKGLLQSIGDAAMSAIKGFTSLGPLGIALGLAAAGTVTALGYKFMKGDDVMSKGGSEGGYGNRILLTPKGSIALNNQDTIIAGTNLNKPKTTAPVTQPSAPQTQTQNLNNNINLQVNLDGRKMSNINVRNNNRIGMNSKVLGRGIDTSN